MYLLIQISRLANIFEHPNVNRSLQCYTSGADVDIICRLIAPVRRVAVPMAFRVMISRNVNVSI